MSHIFRIKTDSNLRSVLNQLSTYDGKTRLKIEEVTSNAVKTIAKGAKNRVPVKKGKLKKSIRSKFNKKIGVGDVFTTLQTAHLIEFGVKAHTVEPNEKFMRVKGSFIGKKIKLPGFSARPFLKPAYEEELPHFISEIKKAVKP